MSTPYDDIINLPHHTSKIYKPMDMEARAAQFAPFAALTGHNDVIAETARVTDRRHDLSEDELNVLAQKVNILLTLEESPTVDITYFKPDERKAGGAYITVKGRIRKVETCFNILTLDNGLEIPLDNISDISSKIFV